MRNCGQVELKRVDPELASDNQCAGADTSRLTVIIFRSRRFDIYRSEDTRAL